MRKIALLIVTVLTSICINAQGYLHADGIKIVDGAGENTILRGIGTGNWMLMEGYMMKMEDVWENDVLIADLPGTQHEFRARLIDEIGEERTNEFFNTWLSNHFTRADVDSMKVWGFNSIRAALHYNLFTLPIEKESNGENTWLDKGFTMIDSLLDWCEANEMYLILDMHGAPGGQGKNADISDYDHTKPSLWESVDNQNKLTALWYELAKRYANEPWIGGYDLINETNWDFEDSGNENGVNCVFNIPLLEMHKRLIDTVRTIDNNHIVFVSGNSWGNNYSGMDELASYDDNLAYTFHKYWNTNNENDVEWMTSVREELNVPLWMSESGENSNTWYTEAISLFETNNIGWSFWPVKKSSINNIINVETPEAYNKLLKYWKKELSTDLTADEVFDGVMAWAESHKTENCEIQYDVIDAMIRQPHTNETKQYKAHKVGEPIFFSDFDFGKNGYAYFDNTVAYYGGDFTAWNSGWILRSDGVDLETCDDSELNNGQSVGFIADGEWMMYTISTDSAAAYTLEMRHASGANGSTFHIDANGVNISGSLDLPGTGGWYDWETTKFENIIIPGGEVKLKFKTDKAGSNLNYFVLSNPKAIDDVDFVCTNAKTSEDGYEIYLDLNKNATTADENILKADFELLVDLEPVNIVSVTKQVSQTTVLVVKHTAELYSGSDLSISYSGTSVKSLDNNLLPFSNRQIINNLPFSHEIPGKIQAEDFIENNGFGLEDCDDSGAGLNTGWSHTGDYLIYRVHVKETSLYDVQYRVATSMSNAEIIFQISADGENYTALDTMKFSSTGGWQAWQTQSGKLNLNEGNYYIKLLVKQGEHNLNWMRILKTTPDAINEAGNMHLRVYPNPARASVKLESNVHSLGNIYVYNVAGLLVYNANTAQNQHLINTANFNKGIYIIKLDNKLGTTVQKLIVQ